MNRKGLSKIFTVFLILFLTTSIFSLINIQPSYASDVSMTLDNIGDAYVKAGGTAGTNFGDAVILDVIGNIFLDTYRSFIDFDFESLPEGTTIDGATLHIYRTYTANSVNELRFCRVIESWDENTITWNNQPSTGVYVSWNFDATLGWFEVDISDAVDDIENLHGIMIRQANESPGSNFQSRFSSREVTGYEAYLSVNATLGDPGDVTVTLIGDGAQVTGGSIFDVMATNSTETALGSSARVDYWMYNFYHFHTLVNLYQDAIWNTTTKDWDCPTYCTETGYLEYGVGYLDASGEVYILGWKVRIEVVGGDVTDDTSDSNYVHLNITWYNDGDFVKYDEIYCGYEAYTADDNTTQLSLYVDLWLSSDAGDTMVGGAVSSQYYGMESSGWWLWANWGPVGGLQTSSIFYDTLYDENGTTSDISDHSIFGVWTKLAKVAVGSGYTSCDNHMWATTCKGLRFDTLPYGVTLYGIDCPVLMPTTTPNMPLGFFASLGNSIVERLNAIANTLSSAFTNAARLTVDQIGDIFDIFGASDFINDITTFSNTLGSYFATAVSYLVDLVVDIFTLFADIAITIITWFGNTVTTLGTIFDYMWGILDGTYAYTEGAVTAFEYLGEFWETSGVPTLVSLVMIVFWFNSIDQRAKRFGGGWMSFFMGDINSIMSVLSFILDISWRIVNTLIDLATRFITWWM